MTHVAGRALAVVLGVGALLVAAPLSASAHPLGNFTVNRYNGLVVGGDGVTVEHIVDLAEIPTAQRMPAIDSDHDGRPSRSELARWASGQCRAAQGSLRLTVDGHRQRLRVIRSAATTTAGQADLPILRLDCALRADATAATEVDFVDGAAGDQVGWREITARGDGVTLTHSDVPAASRSRRLTSYPKDLLSSPLDIRAAHLAVRPGGPKLTEIPQSAPGVASVVGGVTGSFQGLATSYDGNPLVALTALLAALALGALHAVAPGHGKTIMAFYLSGRRQGAVRAATTVGATITATHTAGVLALGVLVSAGTGFVPARVYPWLTVLSGALVVTVGLTLLRDARRGGHGHSHGPGGHTHEPGGHTHGPGGHTHGPGGHTHEPASARAPALPLAEHARFAGVPTPVIRACPDEERPAEAGQRHQELSQLVDPSGVPLLVGAGRIEGRLGHFDNHCALIDLQSGTNGHFNHQPRDGHSHAHLHPHGHFHPHGHPHPHEHQPLSGPGLGQQAQPGQPRDPDDHSEALSDKPDHDHPEAATPRVARSLVAMGLAGGLLPSPSAVLVFLGALAVGHPWFGVLLVVAFGLGMATTLATVGVLVTRLRERVERHLVGRGGRASASLLRRLPLVTATAVSALGVLVTLKGLGSLGS